MSKWPMRGHFRYLRFKTFSMTSRTLQWKLFWAFLSNSKHSGVPGDSKTPDFGSVGLHPHTWPKWGCDNTPQPRLGGSQHLPPYSILCSSPQGSHPSGFLSWDSQVGVLKFAQLGLLQLWRHITSHADLQLQWGLKQSYSPHRELFNNMSHIAWTRGNWVDSWLLVIWLPTFLLAITCVSNVQRGQCEPILDIYVSIVFPMI
jgi:hypothetical protein